MAFIVLTPDQSLYYVLIADIVDNMLLSNMDKDTENYTMLPFDNEC